MNQQYGIFELTGGGMVVVLQSDLLDELSTRIVAPLVALSEANQKPSRMAPQIIVHDDRHLLMIQTMFTPPAALLKTRLGTAAPMRDDITRAIDLMISGV